MKVVSIPASEGVIARATAIMRVLCESAEDVSISHISATLGVTPSSVHRLLDDLVRAQWVERTVHHRYRVAFEFYRLGALGSHRITPVELAKPLLNDLVTRCDETAIFAMRVPGEPRMVLASQANPSRPLHWRFQHHIPRSLMWGAPARAILAWVDEPTQRAVLADAPPSPRGRAAPAWATWSREAEEIRRRRYAVCRDQYTDWAIGYACPVFGLSDVIGALAFVLPQMRLDMSNERRIVAALQDAAARLSRSLGAPAAAAWNQTQPELKRTQG